jgi:hypothetical protein
VKPSELAAIVRGIAPFIREHLERSTAAITARVDAVEVSFAGLKPEVGPQGERGERGPAGEKGEAGFEGQPGRDGRDGQPGVPGLQGEKGVDGLSGKDGRDGVDGKDGLGFEELEAEYDDRGRMFLCFTRGDIVKRFRVPGHADQGVYRDDDKGYLKGDSVTWGGSQWTAQLDQPPGRPGTEGSGWRLSVKKGTDGKAGPKGEQGDRGPQGQRGNDGRNGH